MGLYHSGFFKLAPRILGLLLLLLAAACAAPKATQASITISITADDQTNPLQLHAGSTVQQALDAAGLSLGLLDRVEPPVYTVLGQGSQVRIVRVTEEFEIEQVEIGYSRQIIRNESLAKEEEILIQKGKNGLKEITYRRVFEDGVEITSQPVPVKVTILEEPLPEIVMVGIQAPIAPVNIPGRLFFLRDGNLWLIEGSTGNRRAILTTGDLDGRILSLSPDNSWLLFTRRASEEGQINTLWAANILTGTSGLSESEPLMVDLKVPNVIHFADWIAGPTLKVIFSTVEPRSAAPGWQANNDLNILTFSTTGWSTKWATLVEANAGGVYGWWGASLTWLPDRSLLSFARPDGLGVVNTKNGVITTTLDIVPWQARGDWAWVPGFSWGPDGGVLYTVRHTASAGALSPEESPVFDLVAQPLGGRPLLPLVSQTGMFAYPLASPLQTSLAGDIGYQIAYLQALFPAQSDTSRYRLNIMDRDGSNQRELFPSEEDPGLEPQRFWGAWSPEPMPETGHYAIAVLYQGNIWLVDTTSGEAVQLTSDGLTNRILWTSGPTLQPGD